MVTNLRYHYPQESMQADLLGNYLVDTTRRWMMEQEDISLGELAAGMSHYLQLTLAEMIGFVHQGEAPDPRELSRLLQSWKVELCQTIDSTTEPYQILSDEDAQ